MPFLPHAPKGVGGGAANIFMNVKRKFTAFAAAFCCCFRDAKLRSIRI